MTKDSDKKFGRFAESVSAGIKDGFPGDLAACFVVIWTLLSRIPLPESWWPEKMPKGDRALALAPLAGGLLGMTGGIAAVIVSFAGGRSQVSAWAAAAVYFLAGWSLHLDGWGDLWDGIGSGRRGEALREIMKDSRLGSFGGASLVLAFGLWTSLLASTAPHLRFSACVVSAASARFAEDCAAFYGRYPWEEGMAKGWVDEFSSCDLFVSALCLLPFSVLSPLRAALCAALGGVTGISLALFMNRRLGGVNGDVLGASAVAAEIASLAVWALW
ncbi:MAG: adenosylcobinamide-GDP ribazoletransferase [Synergistes sp.]|nr:adenosylcobinamide-GDP ribazoletransferase [Synergistes sp.]